MLTVSLHWSWWTCSPTVRPLRASKLTKFIEKLTKFIEKKQIPKIDVSAPGFQTTDEPPWFQIIAKSSGFYCSCNGLESQGSISCLEDRERSRRFSGAAFFGMNSAELLTIDALSIRNLLIGRCAVGKRYDEFCDKGSNSLRNALLLFTLPSREYNLGLTNGQCGQLQRSQES